MPKYCATQNKRNRQAKATRNWHELKGKNVLSRQDVASFDSKVEVEAATDEIPEPIVATTFSLTGSSTNNASVPQPVDDAFVDINILLERDPKWCFKTYDGGIHKAKRPPLQKGVMSQEEYEEIKNTPLNVESVPKEPSPIEGYRIVQLGYVLERALQLQFEHSQVCTLGKVCIKKEERRSLGLVSVIVLHCTMCSKLFKITTENSKTPVLNKAAVWGSLSTGSTYTHLDELLSVMNVPTMPENMFYKIENELGEQWKQSLWLSMEAAGVKERENAVALGNLTSDGVPYITVYIDGSWSKRSYGTNYNALSGMVGIIGRHTGELVYIAVRNKYCSICAFAGNRNELPKEHTCYKNWSDSAPAMEADMATEGFCISKEMHGVRYLKFIADGDSSVFAKLKEKVPYGKDIRKVECTNHALKNYGKRLYQIKKDTHIDHKGRKLLTGTKIKLLQKRAKCSIYEHANSGQEGLQLLRHDLQFGVHHVFGDHSECRDNICNNLGVTSSDKIPDLKSTNIYYHLTGAIDLLIRKAHLLIENENNTRAERLMNIVARFNMGKRLNLIQRGSYERRVHLAGLRHNKGFNWHRSPFKAVTKKSPGKYFQNFIDRSNAHKESKARKQLFDNVDNESNQRKKRKIFDSRNTQGNTSLLSDYGPNAAQPELDPEILAMEVERLLQNLKVDVTERNDIEKSSKGQFGDVKYLAEREHRLTASMFGRIMNRKPHTSCHNIVKSCLQPQRFLTEATDYGIAKETVAVRLFEKKTGLTVERSGLWVDLTHGFLGASPDGLVIEEDALVEVKALYSASSFDKMTMKEVLTEMKAKKKPVCLEQRNDEIHLKTNHPYYYQIQGQLNIADRSKCYFVVYVNDSVELFVEEIYRDIACWNNMLPKLTQFFVECIAPEVVRGNLAKGLKCVDPQFISEAIASFEAKKLEKLEKKKKKVVSLVSGSAIVDQDLT